MRASGLILATAIAVLCCVVVPSTACNGVSAPEISLSELHGGCYTDHRSRHPDCVSAMHRYCNRVTYPASPIIIGVSREATDNRIGLSCISAQWKGDVSIEELRRFHGGCGQHKAQHRDCLSAIHRYCKDRFGGSSAGLSQEQATSSYLVGCFRATRKADVRHQVLSELIGGNCRFPDSDSPACFAAASRYCRRYYGYTGGITQEVTSEVVHVACYNAEYSGDAFTIRNSDFYLSRNRATEICDLNFNIPQGTILDSGPEVLGMERYDNSGSDIPLQSTFTFSTAVTETSRFEYSSSITISAEVSISVDIPFGSSVGISLSTSRTSTFGTSEETSTTKTYTHSTHVEVPPGTIAIRDAAITRATLEVPWTAHVRNGLGAVVRISGLWYGVSTYDLQISQRTED